MSALEDPGTVYVIENIFLIPYHSLFFLLFYHLFLDIDKLYQEQDKDDYSEGIVDIYVALAAKALSNYCRAKRGDSIVQQTSAEFAKKLVEYLKIVDEKQRLNEYTWLIRGFFEISRGTVGCITFAVNLSQSFNLIALYR